MGFTAKILSWRFRHLNIVGCLLTRRPTKGGSRAPQDPPLVGLLLSKQPTIFRWRKRHDNILAVKAIVEKPTFSTALVLS